MVEGLIGKKVGMSQVFDAEGNVVSVTVIQAGPCAVIQKKTVDKDGYEALQLGFVEGKPVKRPNKAVQGHFKASGIPAVRKLQEVACSDIAEFKEGDQLSVDMFEIGETIHISGVSKGKGFAGVMKRHHFGGGGGAHGSMFHRAPGSIGASSYPSRVIKGMRMGGHMGCDKVTIRNIRVVDLDKENNMLVVEGSVPGAKGGYLFIRKGAFRPETDK